MKNIKTYEAFKLSDIKKYIIYYNDYQGDYEIVKFVAQKQTLIEVIDLFMLKGDEITNLVNLDQEIYNTKIDNIKFTSDDLEECKKQLLLIGNMEKYNI